MGTFVDAFNQGAIQRTNGNIIVECTYDLGDGNHDVEISGSKTNVKTGDGNSNIVHYGSDATITTGAGNNKITSIGNNKTITTDSGDDEVVFLGNNCNVNTGNGNNKVVFYGDNCNVTMGNGDDNVTTFDQVYKEGKYANMSDVFLSMLPTGVWEDWNKVSSHCIDYKVQKSLMSKTKTWVFEEHYNVETFFSQYINGVQNCNIDMGSGKNTGNITLGANSTVKSNGTNITKSTDDVTINEKWQIDTSLGTRDETKLRTEQKTSSRAGGIFVAAAAAVVAVVATIATAGAAGAAIGGALASGASALGASAGVAGAIGTVGTVVGTVGAAAGFASAGVTLANTGYNIVTGQANSDDWINAGMSLAKICTGAGILGGLTNVVGTASHVASGVKSAEKIASGKADWTDYLSLAGDAMSAYSYGTGLVTDTIPKAYKTACNTVKKVGSTVSDAASSAGTAIKNGVTSVGNYISEGTEGLGTTIWNGIKSGANSVYEGGKSVVNGVTDFVCNPGEYISAGGKWIANTANQAWDGACDIAKGTWDFVTSPGDELEAAGKWISDKWNAGKVATNEAWNATKDYASKAWDTTTDVISDGANATWDGITWTGEKIADGANYIYNAGSNGLQAVGDFAVNQVTTGTNTVVNAIKNPTIKDLNTLTLNDFKQTVPAISGFAAFVEDDDVA